MLQDNTLFSRIIQNNYPLKLYLVALQGKIFFQGQLFLYGSKDESNF